MLAVGNFHYIREDFKAPYPSIFGLTPRQFESQLEILSKQGRFISQDDLLSSDKLSTEDKLLLITFDDGLKEQFELAKPILDRMGIPFICFINTSNFSENKVSLVHKIHLLRSIVSSFELEKRILEIHFVTLNEEEKNKAHIHYNYDPLEVARLKYLLNFKIAISDLKKIIDPLFNEYFNEIEVSEDLYMNMNQLKTLYSEDSLASHGHNHDPLGLMKTEDVEIDLEKTQDFFISNFKGKANLFSYPYGSYEASKELALSLKKHQFKAAFTMERAINKDVSINPFLLARYDCNDLPGGKASKFTEKKIFEDPDFAKWHTYENSTFNQQ